MSTNPFTRETSCETCGLMICLCLNDDLGNQRGAPDDLANQLAASVAILESQDKAWLRRVIHLAEGRIMEIENCSLRGELSNEGRKDIGGVDPAG